MYASTIEPTLLLALTLVPLALVALVSSFFCRLIMLDKSRIFRIISVVPYLCLRSLTLAVPAVLVGSYSSLIES
jgi:hypothetical protein